MYFAVGHRKQLIYVVSRCEIEKAGQIHQFRLSYCIFPNILNIDFSDCSSLTFCLSVDSFDCSTRDLEQIVTADTVDLNERKSINVDN